MRERGRVFWRDGNIIARSGRDVDLPAAPPSRPRARCATSTEASSAPPSTAGADRRAAIGHRTPRRRRMPIHLGAQRGAGDLGEADHPLQSQRPGRRPRPAAARSPSGTGSPGATHGAE